MIIGIGTDLCEIGRIQAALDRFGPRFAAKILVASELTRFARHRKPAAYLAKRFAAKEAASKALGTGFRAGVFWRDLGVVNLPSGQPTLRLTGGAAERLKAITPAGHGAVIALTMTDEFPYAQAMVVITAVPLP